MFTDLFDGAAPDETLLFYFSGHGELRDDNNVVLCTANTDPNDLYSDTIIINHLANRVSLSPSRHKIVVMDCCWSGTGGSGDVKWGTDAAVFLTSATMGRRERDQRAHPRRSLERGRHP